jgi:hypothetical protein
VKRRKRRVVILAAAIGSGVFLAVTGPALARVVQSGLVAAVEHGISGSVTYRVTDEGHDVGQTTTGVVGQGTISGKLSLGAQLAATVLEAVKGVPMAGIAGGGSYVVRYDIDAKGNHKGIVVIRFKSSGVGSLCLDFTADYGRFVPGKTDYVPSAGTFSTVGGSGAIAKMHASGRYTQGEVTGSTIEQILGSGSVVSLTTGAAAPLSSACAAVAKLATP